MSTATMSKKRLQIEKGNQSLERAVDSIIKLARAYETLGNEKLYDDMMRIGFEIKKARAEYNKA